MADNLYLNNGQGALCTGFCLLAIAIASGCAPVRNRSIDRDVWRTIDETVQSFQVTQRLPGLSIAVSKGREIAFSRGYGWADIDQQRPVTPRTMFPIGSIEKQFTASAIMRLVEQGRIRLEEPITNLLPRLHTGGEVVTIGAMLHQVSGLQDPVTLEKGRERDLAPVPDKAQWGPIPDEAVGHDFASHEDIGSFSGQPLYFSPGERFSYSQPNYDLLCYVIAATTGNTYYQVIRDLAHSAGLEAFHAEWAPRPAEADADVARGYRMKDGAFEVAWESNLGSAWTTAADLARWSRALDTGGILSEQSRARMTEPAQLNDGRTWPYGLGLGLLEMAGKRKIMHTGRVIGFYAVLTRYPDADLTIAIMTNLGAASRIAYELEPEIARTILGLGEPEIRDQPLEGREMVRFVGSYDAGAFWFDVVPEGSRVALIMRVAGGEAEHDVYDRRTLLFQGGSAFVADGAPEWRDVFFSPDSGPATEIALGYFAQGVRRSDK